VGALEQGGGALLMVTVLADVFLTVLYARVGTGLLSRRLAQTTWAMFKSIPAGRQRPLVLSLCGPAILVLLVLTWSMDAPTWMSAPVVLRGFVAVR